MAILVTGGAGYIGSHTCVELLEAGYEVVVLDNLVNASQLALQRVEEITGKKISFYQVDLLDKIAVTKVFERENIEAVVHFAGYKAVGESVAKPLGYYHNNMTGTFILCEVMAQFGVKNLVFSSSATVYGEPQEMPITEDCPQGAITNPYGQTKAMLEQVLRDLQTADEEWNIVLLRYFNPIGAHPSGRIGEDPDGIPNNLAPYVAQVAVGKHQYVEVFGNDYPTVDGTGIRDYIHVVDLALGHVKAVEKMHKQQASSGLRIYNLGTGNGYSVLEVIAAFETASGSKIPYQIAPRRAGDIAVCYADVTRAKEELGWEAKRNLQEMCQDTWRWQQGNPEGYTK